METNEEVTGSGVGAAYQMYAVSWIFNFVVALLGALIANGIYNVPLFQVVNVNLSVALFFAFSMAAIQAVLLVYSVVTVSISRVVGTIVGIVLALLVPFASIAAYQVYAWLGGLSVSGESFIYDEFMSMFAAVMKEVAVTFGQFTAQKQLPELEQGAGDLLFGLRLQTIEVWASLLAALLSISYTMMLFQRARETSYTTVESGSTQHK
jgi:hypothetical protein